MVPGTRTTRRGGEGDALKPAPRPPKRPQAHSNTTRRDRKPSEGYSSSACASGDTTT